MVVKVVVGVTVAITVVRGIKAADWILMRQLPGQEWTQRGPALDQQTACLTALASDGIVVPPGTRLKCERVVTTKEAAR
jgi:hypothetical protein